MGLLFYLAKILIVNAPELADKISTDSTITNLKELGNRLGLDIDKDEDANYLMDNLGRDFMDNEVYTLWDSSICNRPFIFFLNMEIARANECMNDNCIPLLERDNPRIKEGWNRAKKWITDNGDTISNSNTDYKQHTEIESNKSEPKNGGIVTVILVALGVIILGALYIAITRQ